MNELIEKKHKKLAEQYQDEAFEPYDEKLIEKDRQSVLIVVNHCDSHERLIGTDKLLRVTQQYGFGMVELSSTSGVNLEFLMSHIVDLLIDDNSHRESKVLNVIQKYDEEYVDLIERLRNTYKDVVE